MRATIHAPLSAHADCRPTDERDPESDGRVRDQVARRRAVGAVEDEGVAFEEGDGGRREDGDGVCGDYYVWVQPVGQVSVGGGRGDNRTYACKPT